MPPLSVRVYVNSQFAGTVLVHRELEWNEIQIPLPTSMDATKPVIVELRTATVRTEGSSDQRAFGVAVASIELR